MMMLQFYLMPKAENLTKNGIQKLQHGKLQLILIRNNMKSFLHIGFIISIILLMIILLIPAIILYMFTGYNLITELHFEAGKLERKYFE
jgi:hypothetical protein